MLQRNGVLPQPTATNSMGTIRIDHTEPHCKATAKAPVVIASCMTARAEPDRMMSQGLGVQPSARPGLLSAIGIATAEA